MRLKWLHVKEFQLSAFSSSDWLRFEVTSLPCTVWRYLLVLPPSWDEPRSCPEGTWKASHMVSWFPKTAFSTSSVVLSKTLLLFNSLYLGVGVSLSAASLFCYCGPAASSHECSTSLLSQSPSLPALPVSTPRSPTITMRPKAPCSSNLFPKAWCSQPESLHPRSSDLEEQVQIAATSTTLRV